MLLLAVVIVVVGFLLLAADVGNFMGKVNELG